MADARIEMAMDALADMPLKMPAGSPMEAFQERARTLMFLALIMNAAEIDDPEFGPNFAEMAKAGEGLTENDRVAVICKGLIDMIAAGQANDLMEYVRGHQAGK